MSKVWQRYEFIESCTKLVSQVIKIHILIMLSCKFYVVNIIVNFRSYLTIYWKLGNECLLASLVVCTWSFMCISTVRQLHTNLLLNSCLYTMTLQLVASTNDYLLIETYKRSYCSENIWSHDKIINDKSLDEVRDRNSNPQEQNQDFEKTVSRQ